MAASVGAILSSIRIKDREPERRRRGSQFDVTLSIGAGVACGGGRGGHAGLGLGQESNCVNSTVLTRGFTQPEDT